MRPAEVRQQIAAGRAAALYLLEGDDVQSRHELALDFIGLVEEGLRAFNVQSLHASEASTAAQRDQLIGELLAAARTLPMMAPRRVVIVHQAERLLSPRKGRDEEPDPPAAALAADAGRRRRKGLSPVEELEGYIEAPEPLSTVVFVAGALDGNRRLVKLLRKHAIAVNCGAFATPVEATAWIHRRLQEEGMTIEPRAIKLLLEATGDSPGRLRGELDKLMLYATGEKAITIGHVEAVVSLRADPGEEFALLRAIDTGRTAVALREVASLLDAGMPPFMVLGQIRAATRRLQPDVRARHGLDAVLQTDIALKSSIGEPRHVLERLVVELCAPW